MQYEVTADFNGKKYKIKVQADSEYEAGKIVERKFVITNVDELYDRSPPTNSESFPPHFKDIFGL